MDSGFKSAMQPNKRVQEEMHKRNDIDLSRKIAGGFDLDSQPFYKADFLWPHEDNSIEQAGYEFANAKTEEYKKQWWDILMAVLGSKMIDIGLCAGREIGRIEALNFCESMGFHAHSSPHIADTIAEWLYYYDLSRSGSIDADRWLDLPDDRRQEYYNIVPDLVKFIRGRNK